jgi:hypothetical protein
MVPPTRQHLSEGTLSTTPISWARDFADALEQARRTRRFVLADFAKEH